MNEPIMDFSGTHFTAMRPDFVFGRGDPHHMRLTLQQLPYSCADPSFESRGHDDVLEQVFVSPYKPATPDEDERRVVTESLPNGVPDDENVKVNVARHDYLPTGPAESEDQPSTYMPSKGVTLLQGPRENESSPLKCSDLRTEVQNAIVHAWRFDTLKFSVSESQGAPSQSSGAPGGALNAKELRYLKALIVPKLQAQRKEVLADSAAAIQGLSWQPYSPENDSPTALDEATLDNLLDDFFGSGPVATRPLENSIPNQVLEHRYAVEEITTQPLDSHEPDEGFFESADCGPLIKTTWVTAPENDHVASGRASSHAKAFQDSGIYIDDAFAEASLSISSQNPSMMILETKPGEANLAPPLRKLTQSPRLCHSGGNSEHEWRSECEAPYDLEGFASPSPGYREGFGDFEQRETHDANISENAVSPNSHSSEVFRLCRSSELCTVDESRAQVVAEAQYEELSNVTAYAVPQDKIVTTNQLPQALETTELHGGVPNHWQREQQVIAADHSTRSTSVAAQTYHQSFGAQDAASTAATTTPIYHPQATFALKHRCLPVNDGLTTEDVKMNSTNTNPMETNKSNDGSHDLDGNVSYLYAHKPSDEVASNQYFQGGLGQLVSTPKIVSTVSMSSISAIHTEDLLLMPQSKIVRNPEHTILNAAADTAFVAALNPNWVMSNDVQDQALNPGRECPSSPMFSPLTTTDDEVDLLEINAQQSSTTNEIHKSCLGSPNEIPNGVCAPAANADSGTHANDKIPVMLKPRTKRLWEPPYQLPSHIDTPPNHPPSVPSRQPSQTAISAIKTPPIKPVSMPGHNLGQSYTTPPRCFMPDTDPSTPTPAPKSSSSRRHGGVPSFRSFKNAAQAKKFDKSVRNIFSSPHLGGTLYRSAEESGNESNQELHEASSDTMQAEEDADEAEATVPRAKNVLKAMRCPKQRPRRQTIHQQPATSSVAKAVVVPSQRTETRKQQKDTKTSSVIPRKNKHAKAQKNDDGEPAAKKRRTSGMRRATRLSSRSSS